MGTTNHKQNPGSLGEKEVFDKMADFLFGGLDEMREQINEAYEMFGHRYKQAQIANALTWMTMRFNRMNDKSAVAMVDEGQMCRPDNPFNKEDATKLYRFVVKKTFLKNNPNATDEVVESFYKSLGNNTDGATTDVIPNAYGEYGFDVTNPIPTRGVPTNEVYLKKLSLLSNEPFHWERIGSFSSPNIKKPIDGYEIITDDGERLCTLYISPYQSVISNTPPKGFYISKTGLIEK
jgi:hypothetical protein